MVVENNISTDICKKCADCCKNYSLIELSKKEINSFVETVVNPDAINCNSSVIAIPVRFVP